MYCENQAAMYIANNFIFHNQTKHIEVHCHFIRDMAMAHRIVTLFVTLSWLLENIFIKILSCKSFTILCSKLSMIDIYALIWEDILE